MRHTRNRQMNRIRNSWYRKNKNYTIEVMNKKLKYELDPTFKWHREFGKDVTPWGYNFIEFQGNTRLVKF